MYLFEPGFGPLLCSLGPLSSLWREDKRLPPKTPPTQSARDSVTVASVCTLQFCSGSMSSPAAEAEQPVEVEEEEEVRKGGGGGGKFPSFPYEPYSIQVDFMDALYSSLERGGIAMLESPTGIALSSSSFRDLRLRVSYVLAVVWCGSFELELAR